jgi:hypothetical protein
VAALFFGMGDIGNAQPNLEVAAEEIRQWADWSINPCKYTYQFYDRLDVETIVNNKAGIEQQFDMGNGDIISVPANSSREYIYHEVRLMGNTVRFYITQLKEGTGLVEIHANVLKVEPKQKGD